MEYTREKLIEICEKSFVNQSDWRNRDSAQSQMKLGEVLALLRCGCEFEIQTKKHNPDGVCVTDEMTIWIQFYVHDFGWFEGYEEDPRGNKSGGYDNYHYYLPTEKRLKECNGKDWY